MLNFEKVECARVCVLTSMRLLWSGAESYGNVVVAENTLPASKLSPIDVLDLLHEWFNSHVPIYMVPRGPKDLLNISIFLKI